MKILITDWGDIDQALPIAMKFRVGMEVLEFARPENLDNTQSLAEEIHQKVSGFPLLSMHGPFSELIPASRDPRVRQVAHSRFQQGYELAQAIGASHLILHSGYLPKTYPFDQWVQNSVDFWVDFLNEKPNPGLIHIENVYEDDFTTLQELIDRVNQAFQDERLTICLDIGHVNANSSLPFERWIPALGDRIQYAHLHNNGGILDDHWQLGKGTINIEHVLELLL